MRKILVSAYGCEPNKGSEPGVGWHWVLEMARANELWVITRSNNEEAINSALTDEQRQRIHFVYYDLPHLIKKIKRKEKGLYPYYFLWQLGAYRLAKRLVVEINYDYCIHLSFGSMWMPTFMYKLPVPFIWGPIGGGESVPFTYLKALPWKARITQYIRYLLIKGVIMNPLFMGPCRAAKAIIVRTKDSRQVFPPTYQSNMSVMLETGMSREVFQYYVSGNLEDNSSFINLIYVGRLVAIKNVEAAIHAVAKTRLANIRFTIVGDGPLKPQLMAVAHELNVQDKIEFMGSVNQDKVIQLLQQNHIFLFPSLKEGGSWSLMEAMAAGLPVICLDTTGMHVITDDDCAIRIKPSNPKETVQKMAEAIATLANSQELRRKMGNNGRDRIQKHFLWSNKGKFMDELLSHLDHQLRGRSKR